jgi:DNA-binding MarR family transcriptional regulator
MKRMNNAPTQVTSTQRELFEAETSWFHVFKAMIDSGDLATMSGSSVKVYLVIKAHTSFSTGRAFPAIETIAEKAGLSRSQVLRELKALEAFGYLSKAKIGRRNEYRLREKVQITDDTGRPTAVATWDYLPSTVKEAVADLRNVLVSGDLAGSKIVHIERLQLNINVVQAGGVAINLQGALDSVKDPELRQQLTNLFSKLTERKAESG